MLDFKTLKIVRRVSPIWKSASTNLMFSKGYFQVPPGFYDGKKAREKKRMMTEYLSSDLIKIPNLLLREKKDEEVLFKILGAHNEDVTHLKISQDWKGGQSLAKKLPNLKIISSLKTDQYFRFGHNGVLFELSSNRKTPLIVSHLFFYPLEKLELQRTGCRSFEIDFNRYESFKIG